MIEYAMVSRPVCLGARRPIWGPYQIFNTVRQLKVCCYGVPSLTRGWVCSSQLLLVLTSAIILGSESCGTHNHILLSQIRDSPNLKGQVPVFIYPGTGLPSYTPRHWVKWMSSSSSYIATNGQSASSSWCRAPFGTDDQILHFFEWQLLSFFFM
jgi:hypothetical protein